MFSAFFENGAALFTIPAILGTLFFLLRMGLMAAGAAGGDADFDAGGDLDVAADVDAMDADVDAVDVDGATDAFKFVSVQSIAGFVMGFGWGGLIGRLTLEWDMLSSAALGVGGGLLTAWILVWVFRLIYSLQSSGNISISDTVGHEGRVYATVPARGEGRGQVQVVVNQRARLYNAVTEGDSITTGDAVRVVRVNGDNTLTVIRA